MLRKIILSKLLFAMSVSTIPLIVAVIINNVWVSYLAFPVIFLAFTFARSVRHKNSAVSQDRKINWLKIILPKFIYQAVEFIIPIHKRQSNKVETETNAVSEKISPELPFKKEAPAIETIPDKIDIAPEPLKILIADDHAIVRKGLKQVILDEYPSALIGEAGDGEAVIQQLKEKEWNIVVCDLTMPGSTGLDVLTEIKQTAPQLPVLIMSMFPEDQYAIRVLKSGAAGYLGKDSVLQDIIEAIQTVQSGKKWITPSVAEKLAASLGQNLVRPTHETLSDRELEIFKLLASGKSISEIAAELSLSATTVSTYRARILEKMEVHTNAELTRYALEKNLI